MKPLTPQQKAMLYVVAGIVVLMVLARYIPRIAGLVLLALTIGLLASASQKGALT